MSNALSTVLCKAHADHRPLARLREATQCACGWIGPVAPDPPESNTKWRDHIWEAVAEAAVKFDGSRELFPSSVAVIHPRTMADIMRL